MHLDVRDLRDFYYRTQLGRVAQRAIRDQLLRLWTPAPAQTVAGFGFAVPLLRPYLPQARRVIGLMPGPQGVMPWPAGMPNVSVLCDETAWPLSTGFVDRLVLMHGLETSEQPTAVLEEAQRVLGPGGKLVVVVPNRAGLWARRDLTPFGFGRPYSNAQLETQLRAHGFTPERSLTVLHAPPSQAPFWLRTADVWERLGQRLPWLSGGVLMVEASKLVQAPTRGGLRAVVKRPLSVLEGVRGVSPEPAMTQTPRDGASTPFAPDGATIPFAPNGAAMPFAPDGATTPFASDGAATPFAPNGAATPFAPNGAAGALSLQRQDGAGGTASAAVGPFAADPATREPSGGQPGTASTATMPDPVAATAPGLGASLRPRLRRRPSKARLAALPQG